MANFLGSFLDTLACASHSVVGACYLVGDFAQRRAGVILRILLYATEKWTVMSESVANLLATVWHQEEPTVVSTSTAPLIVVTGNDARAKSVMSTSPLSVNGTDSDDTATTEETASDSSSSKDSGVEALQGVFLSSKKKRRSKRAYNRVGLELQAQQNSFRAANKRNGTTTAALTSAQPASPAACSASAPRNSSWRDLETLRSGPRPGCNSDKDDE